MRAAIYLVRVKIDVETSKSDGSETLEMLTGESIADFIERVRECLVEMIEEE